MFANAKALVVVVSCVLVAQAQSTETTTAPASLPTLDTCITDCLTLALPSGPCTSYTDVTCVCTSTGFQQAATACLTANCTTDDLAIAEQLQSEECATLTSASVPATTATATSNGTSTSAAASETSASATSTSAAMALSAPFSLGSIVGTLVASAGALIGAAFVL